MLLGLFSLTGLCFALAPTAATWIGVEPVRIHRFHAASQARLARQAAWEEFSGADGTGWAARFDERSGAVHRAWGPGIPLGALRSEKDVEAALRQFLARNPALVGVPLDELRLRTAGYVARTDTWYVDFDRLVDGIPVWRSGFTARIRTDKLILFGADTYPGVERAPAAKLDGLAAIAVAEIDGPASLGRHTDESAALVLLPMDAGRGVELRLAWEVRSRTPAPLGAWVSHVDARTGQLLNVYNDIRFLDGVLYGRHDSRTVDGALSTSPLPLATLTGDASGTSTTTGADGAFSIDASEAWTTQLRGSYLTVRNEAGGEGSLSFTDAAPTWTDAEATQAEIDVYKFLHDVRDWGLEIAPEVGMSTVPLRATVNLDSACNAYYDGDLNFYEEGNESGYNCNNTGRIADVVYHEWGHGFHAYSIESGFPDGSLGEGAGDVIATLQTLDPEIGPYFYTNGGPVRENETNLSYPDDMIGEVHYEGQIFAGAVWDLYKGLSTTYGEAQGEKGAAWRVTATLFADALKAGPGIADSYDEFVVADDDNGDLSDGTPHICELIDAFGLHGLGPNGTGDPLVHFDHDALGNQDAGVAPLVTAELQSLSQACASFDLADAEGVYSIDFGASWDSVALDVRGDTITGSMPMFPAGTVVSYYLVGTDTTGDQVSSPAGGEIAPYTFYVGGLEELYCESFSGDGDYTHVLLDGEDREGADDWDFGQPDGYADDPVDAYTGRSVWGNDLGGGQYNGEYQAEIVNRLSSPAIDVAGASDVVVQFRRWLNVEDGVYDQATVYANDTAVWTNHATTASAGDAHTQDAEWMLHTIQITPDAESLVLAWELASDGGLEFGGWNIDDVCVYQPVGPTTILGVDDFVATERREDGVGLSWTQPDDPRATDAVVVRREDAFPASRSDGEVVFVGEDLPPGESVAALDATIGGYYAVYVGDGTTWTTGAIEGANADEGYRADGGPADGGDDGVVMLGPGGCGCASGGSAGASWLAGAAGLALLVRRRGR